MASPDTNESKPVVDEVVAKAREEVKKEVDQAKAAHKEDDLGRRIIEEVQQVLLHAQEAVDSEQKGNFNQKRIEAEKVQRALARAAEAAKEGIKVSSSDQGQDLLVRLAGKNLTPSVSSAIEVTLADFILGDKPITFSSSGASKTEFETAMGNLQALNYVAGNMMVDFLKQASRKGVIPLKEEEIEQKLSPEIQEKEDSRMRRRNIPSKEDRQGFDDLYKKINSALQDNLANAPDDKKLTGDERTKLKMFLFGDSDIPASELERIFGKLDLVKHGLKREDLAHYSRFYEKNFRQIDVEEIIGMMTNHTLIRHLEDATRVFNINYLRGEGKEGQDILYFKKNDQGVEEVVLDRKRFKKLINNYYYLALKEVHANSSKMFNEIFDPYQHGYYFGGLKGLVGNLCDGLRDQFFQGDPEMKRFLDDVRGRYQASILTYAETFHNLPLYARDASSFEKWPQFLGYLFPSELAEVFDPDDPLMEIARHEIPMYLRRRVVLNGNKMPSDLFSGNYDKEGAQYGFKDRNKMIEILKARVNELGLKVEDWEFERAMTYSLGIGIATLNDIEVLCTADPNTGDFRSLHPLMPVLSAKHNWGLGRGYPDSSYIPDLLQMDVTLFPEERGFLSRLLKKKSWVPKAFHEKVIGNVQKYGDKVFDAMLGHEGQYQELLSMINIGTSLNSRAGWRVLPIREKLRDYAAKDGGYGLNMKWGDARKTWGKKEWRQYVELAMKLYGGSAIWWVNQADRLDPEMRRFLTKHLHGDYDEMEKEYHEYNKGGKSLKKEFEITVNGKQRKINFLEAKNIRNYQFRAEAFYMYFKRNPGDFILLLSQMAPELLNADTNYFLSESEFKKNIPGGKSKIDIEKDLAIRAMLEARWGPQMETLGKIRSWIFNDFKNSREAIINEGKKEGDKDWVKLGKDKLIEYLVEQSGNAYEKVLKDKARHVDKDGKPLPDTTRSYVERGDFDDPELARLIFDENGLMGILKEEDFGGFDEKGDFSYGDQKFFYMLGQVWTLKQGDINPFTADLNHFALYEQLGKPGEDVVKRYLGDTQAVRKMIEGVAQLDQKLLHAANSGDLKEIYEIHKSVYGTLRAIISEEYAFRANYIMASIVAKFFYEHSLTRVSGMPSIISYLFKSGLGHNSALSKIVTHNRHAKTMDENGVRDYFMKLAYDMHVIAPEGVWSREQLELAYDAKTDTFLFGDAIPNFTYFLLFYLWWIYMKRAMEEAEGKKK